MSQESLKLWCSQIWLCLSISNCSFCFSEWKPYMTLAIPFCPLNIRAGIRKYTRSQLISGSLFNGIKRGILYEHRCSTLKRMAVCWNDSWQKMSMPLLKRYAVDKEFLCFSEQRGSEKRMEGLKKHDVQNYSIRAYKRFRKRNGNKGYAVSFLRWWRRQNPRLRHRFF